MSRLSVLFFTYSVKRLLCTFYLHLLVKVPFPGGYFGICLFVKVAILRRLWGSPRTLSPEVQRLKLGAYHSAPSTSEIKNAWNFTYMPTDTLGWCKAAKDVNVDTPSLRVYTHSHSTRPYSLAPTSNMNAQGKPVHVIVFSVPSRSDPKPPPFRIWHHACSEVSKHISSFTEQVIFHCRFG